MNAGQAPLAVAVAEQLRKAVIMTESQLVPSVAEGVLKLAAPAGGVRYREVGAGGLNWTW